MLMDRQTKNRQTSKQNYTNFESNLAMLVVYLPVKFEFNWTKRFPVTVPEPNLNVIVSVSTLYMFSIQI